jgi:hypothetical protein
MSHITSTWGRAWNNTHPTTTVPLLNQSHQPPQLHSQSHWQRQQVTPPPTPPAFDARGAAAKLRTIDGYVSFANIEGLGGLPGVEEDVMEEDRHRETWWLWRGRSWSALIEDDFHNNLLLKTPAQVFSDPGGARKCEARRLESKVARVASKKCHVEEVTALQKEVDCG